MRKKIFSIFISLAMVLTMMPLTEMTVSAEAPVAQKVTFTLGGFGSWKDGHEAPDGWEKSGSNYIRKDGVAAGTPVSNILNEWNGYEPDGLKTWCKFEGWEHTPSGDTITADTTFTATFRCDDTNHHSFGAVNYNWDSLPQCTASTVCLDCGQILQETKTAEFREDTPATVIYSAYGEYHVDFNDSRFGTSKKSGEGSDGPLKHVFTEGHGQVVDRTSTDDVAFRTNVGDAWTLEKVYIDGVEPQGDNGRINDSGYIYISMNYVNNTLADGKHTITAKLDGVDNDATAEFTVAHTMDKHNKVEPTVLADGSKEYYECTHCNKYYEDADGTIEITQDINTWKVIPKLTHEIIRGQNQTHRIGSDTHLCFESNGIDEYFSAVLVDGIKVDEANYTHESGYDGILVTFKSTYLDTLAEGEHTVAISMTGAEDATETFKVASITYVDDVKVTVKGFDKTAPFFTPSNNVDSKCLSKTETFIYFIKDGEILYYYNPEDEKWRQGDDEQIIPEPANYLDCDYAVMGYSILINWLSEYKDPLKVSVNNKELGLVNDADILAGKSGYDFSSNTYLNVYYAVPLGINTVDFTIDGFNTKAPYFKVSTNIDSEIIDPMTYYNHHVWFYKDGKAKYVYDVYSKEWGNVESDKMLDKEPSDLLDCDYVSLDYRLFIDSVYSDPLKVRVNGKELENIVLSESEIAKGKSGYFVGNDNKSLFIDYTLPLAGIHDCVDANNDHKCDICGKVLSKCVDKNHDHKCDICGKILSKHVDKDNDGKCDICEKAMSGVDTGDNNNALPYGITMVLALAGMGFAAKKRREN